MPNSELIPVFRRIYADRLLMDSTRIFWELDDAFCAIGTQPYTFQLQYAETAVETGNWTDVGLPAENAAMLVDDEQRDFGGFPTAHYRVQLTTADDEVYTSPAVPVWGILPERQLLWAREMIRKFQLDGQETDTPGWLFKRKSMGEVDTDNVDYQTDEVIDPYHDNTKGTAFVGGYYDPIDFGIGIEPGPTYNRRDPKRGQIDDIDQVAEIEAWPMVRHGDIWVAKYSDLRYKIHWVKPTTVIQNYPLIVQIGLKMCGHKHPAYMLEIPDA